MSRSPLPFRASADGMEVLDANGKPVAAGYGSIFRPARARANVAYLIRAANRDMGKASRTDLQPSLPTGEEIRAQGRDRPLLARLALLFTSLWR